MHVDPNPPSTFALVALELWWTAVGKSLWRRPRRKPTIFFIEIWIRIKKPAVALVALELWRKEWICIHRPHVAEALAEAQARCLDNKLGKN